MLTLRLPPRFVQPLIAMELQSTPFEHQLAVTLRRVSDAEAERRINATRRQGHEWSRLLARVRGEQRHAELPDHVLLQQQADSDDVLSRLAAGEKLFDVSVQLWLCAPDRAELQRRTDIALDRFRALGRAEGAIEELQPTMAFLGMLPGHQSIVGDRFHPMLASRAADLLPVYQSARGAAHPTTILSTRSRDLVGFDPFDKELQAWNATIAGGSGAGKSFMARTLLSGWIASGGRAVIATRGNDYHRYAAIFDAPVEDVCLDDANLCLGPFPPYSDVRARRDAQATMDHLANIIAVMVTEPDHPPSRLQRRLIFNATQTLYAMAPESAPGAPTLDDWLAALMEVSARDATNGDTVAAAGIIEQAMRFWLDGPYGAAFRRNRAQTTDAAPRTPLEVWNLGSISDNETQGVVLALLSGIIAQSIEVGPTIVVFDEVWSLLGSAAGAGLVETLYRTVRKQGSAIWTISQSMNDYVGLTESCRSAILNNSPIKHFLAHDPSEIDLVAKTFKLNEREAQLLGSLRSVPGQFSEMLSFVGARRQVLRLHPTGIEYWLATSHPNDCAWESAARAAMPEVSTFTVLRRLARKFPHGAVRHTEQAA